MSDPNAHPDHLISPRTLVITGMIAVAVAVRLFVHFVPGVFPYNFTPVAAMALFGGAYFSNRKLALLVPLLAMFVADMVIGLQTLSPVVYLCFAAMVLVGMLVLRGRTSALRVGLTAVGSATGFYLVTNFSVWLGSGMYAMSASGLLACYIAGLPFYQYGSLPGTLVWSTLLFGGFALLTRRFSALRLQPLAV
ncbi:MAG: hypothetical protein L0H70_01925 [Xanthomonadales bacterium]|nr:hypothetical protein [Xanthomonadales bacterium]